jgi:hypothetical protein
MTRLAYFEWSADEGAEHDDPEAWAQANPALGLRISADFIRTERLALPADDWARERLGIFPEDVDTTEPAIDQDDWKACINRDSRPLDPVVFAFEVSIDRKWGVIGAAGLSNTGPNRTHVELVDNRRGTGWMVQRLIELRDKQSPTAILCNPAGPAGGLLPSCEKAGLVVGVPDSADSKGKTKYRSLTGRDYAQACQAAYDDITEHRWCHFGDDPVLNVAVGGAGKRTVGDAWVFDRRGAVDISALVAVALAGWGVGRAIPEEPTPEPFMIIT